MRIEEHIQPPTAMAITIVPEQYHDVAVYVAVSPFAFNRPPASGWQATLEMVARSVTDAVCPSTAGDEPIEEVQQLPAAVTRIETGAVRFGNDWPGMFIRGDDCLGLLSALQCLNGIFRRVQLTDDEIMQLTKFTELRETIETYVLI
jgi:hypothetical protein